MISVTHDNSAHQKRCPHRLTTASLAVSKQILHSKFALDASCWLLLNVDEEDEADGGTVVDVDDDDVEGPEILLLLFTPELLSCDLSEFKGRL